MLTNHLTTFKQKEERKTRLKKCKLNKTINAKTIFIFNSLLISQAAFIVEAPAVAAAAPIGRIHVQRPIIVVSQE